MIDLERILEKVEKKLSMYGQVRCTFECGGTIRGGVEEDEEYCISAQFDSFGVVSSPVLILKYRKEGFLRRKRRLVGFRVFSPDEVTRLIVQSKVFEQVKQFQQKVKR